MNQEPTATTTTTSTTTMSMAVMVAKLQQHWQSENETSID